MDSAQGKKFKDQEIVIDSKTAYVSCTFTNCHFVYTGGDFSFVNCTIVPGCKVTITGDAGKTLMFMQMVGMIPPPQAPPAAIPESSTLH